LSNLSAYSNSSTEAIIAYTENSAAKTADVSISGDLVSYLSFNVFDNSGSNSSVVMLDSTKIIDSYIDQNGSGMLRVGSRGDISQTGDPIYLGDATTYTAESTSYNKVTALTADKAVFSYRKSDGTGGARVCSINATTGVIDNCGTEQTFSAGLVDNLVTERLDSTSLIFAWNAVGDTGKTAIATINGNIITVGSEYTFNNGSTGSLDVTALSDSRVVIAYEDAANSSYVSGVVGDISGTTISLGSEYATTDVVGSILIDTLTVNEVILVYSDVIEQGEAAARVLTVGAGPEITFGTPAPITSTVIDDIDAMAVGSDNFVAIIHDSGNSGTLVYGEIVTGIPALINETTFEPEDTLTGDVELTTDVNSPDSGIITGIYTTEDGLGDEVNRVDFEVLGDDLTVTASETITTEATNSSAALVDDSVLVVAYNDNASSDLGAGILSGDQEFNGAGAGGAIPEYTTPIAIALALGVGLIVVLMVRSRYAKNGEEVKLDK
jgi:hypothetical protein